MAKHSIHETAMISSLAHAKVTAITEDLSKMKIENELKREIWDNIKRLRDMGAYRGRRHAMALPVRGVSSMNEAGRRWTRMLMDNSNVPGARSKRPRDSTGSRENCRWRGWALWIHRRELYYINVRNAQAQFSDGIFRHHYGLLRLQRLIMVGSTWTS